MSYLSVMKEFRWIEQDVSLADGDIPINLFRMIDDTRHEWDFEPVFASMVDHMTWKTSVEAYTPNGIDIFIRWLPMPSMSRVMSRAEAQSIVARARERVYNVRISNLQQEIYQIQEEIKEKERFISAHHEDYTHLGDVVWRIKQEIAKLQERAQFVLSIQKDVRDAKGDALGYQK